MIGDRLASRYQILEQIGSGGMGVVYRALDERLRREVAVKVLPSDLLADEASRNRLRREALSLSRLNHPRIGTVHDFDTHNGTDFLVMELVSGATWAELLRVEPLSTPEAVRIGAQIAEALEAAHEQGILHCDLKPGNVMVTPKGDVKVLDFGLARRIRNPDANAAGTTLTSGSHTEEGIAGTLPYMAPEQLSQGAVDARADLWALGVILYEMTTGRRPFQGDTFTLIGEILHREPPRARTVRESIPPWLESVILRCLKKDPGERYVEASSVLRDLRETRSPDRSKPRAMAIPISLAAVALVVGVAMLVRFASKERNAEPATSSKHSIAVLPLVNLSGDSSQDFFVDGMTDEITTALAQVGALRVISRTSAMQFKGTRLPLPEIARTLHVDWIVQGSVRETPDSVLIATQLVDPKTDRYLSVQSLERPRNRVLALQNEVAVALAGQIRAAVTPEERARLEAPSVVDAQAHDAYLRGRFYYNQSDTEESLRRALSEFQRAIVMDPTYARAYVGLAETYTQLSSVVLPAKEAMPKAQAAAERALEIDSTLAPAHATLAYIQAFYHWNWEEGEREFRRAIALGQGEAATHQNYGYLLNNLGRFEEAKTELRQAAEIDPLSTFIPIQQLFPLYGSRHYDDAIAAASKVLEADSTAALARFIRAQAYLGKGETQIAYQDIERAYASYKQPLFLAYLGYIDGIEGKRDRALRVKEELEHPPGGRFVQPYTMAVVFVGLGDRDSTFAWLQRGIEERSEEATYVKVDPIMDPIRSDGRYPGILRRIGLSS